MSASQAWCRTSWQCLAKTDLFMAELSSQEVLGANRLDLYEECFFFGLVSRKHQQCSKSDSWLLWKFVLSGPMRAYILAREDAISHWRELMGPTKVFRARFNSPASIRGQFGLTDTRNTTHGSGKKAPKLHNAKKNDNKMICVMLIIYYCEYIILNICKR